MKRVLSSLASIGSLLMATQAFADTTQCINIQSVPITITVQGIYCLKQNLSLSATQAVAITIAAHNVTIDFNGFKLGGLAAGPSSNSVGVRATDRRNVTLRNGNIRGFSWGFILDQMTEGASSGHLVEDNFLDGNLIVGMEVGGSDVLVRRNRIVRTGGNSNAFAIRATDLSNSEISNNFISTTRSAGAASEGISLSMSSGVLVARNTIIDTRGALSVRGIRSQSTAGAIIIDDNTIMTGVSGISNATGISVSGPVLCRNNIVADFTPSQTSGCQAQEGTFPAP